MLAVAAMAYARDINAHLAAQDLNVKVHVRDCYVKTNAQGHNASPFAVESIVRSMEMEIMA